MEGEKIPGAPEWGGGEDPVIELSRPAVSLALNLTMSDNSVRKRIISSVFNRRNASGISQETYVSHVKIWEDAGPEADLKPRFILLARTPNHCSA